MPRLINRSPDRGSARTSARSSLFARARGLLAFSEADLAQSERGFDLLGDPERRRCLEQLVLRPVAVDKLEGPADGVRRNLVHRLETLRREGFLDRRGTHWIACADRIRPLARYADLLLTLSALQPSTSNDRPLDEAPPC